MAVLLAADPEAQEAAQFYQLACTNRGWPVKLFTDRQNAVDWLLGKNGSRALPAPTDQR